MVFWEVKCAAKKNRRYTSRILRLFFLATLF